MGLFALVAFVLVACVALALLGLRLRRDGFIQPATSADKVAYQVAKDRQSAEGLLRHYQLRDRETGFFGKWRETRLHGHRVAFQSGPPLSVMIGEFDPDEEQLTEVYLSKVSPSRPMPDSKGRRLDPDLGSPSNDLSRDYFLNAGLSSNHALLVEDVRRELLALSPAVLDVQIYEANGVQLDLDPDSTTPKTLEDDVARAAAIIDTLEADAASRLR
jgi:hypothetical protein